MEESWKRENARLLALFPDDNERGCVRSALLKMSLPQRLEYFEDSDAATRAALKAFAVRPQPIGLSQGAATNQASSGTEAVAASLRAYADRTTEFLRGHLPLGRLPRHEELRDVFQAGLCVDGRRVRLPVADDLYLQLLMQNSEWEHWLQPNSACGATRLAACVTSALLQPINDPGDEITLATYLDPLIWAFIDLASSALPGSVAVTRRRNRSDASATLKSLRPDFMAVVASALLLKGEEKANAEDMGIARTELVEKMKNWSAIYHGLVDYMLCYAAAGTQVDFGMVTRPGVVAGEAADHPVFHSLLGPLNLVDPLTRVQLIHAALLSFCIIQQQSRRLPQRHIPLGNVLQRAYGTSITFLGGEVHKEVVIRVNPWLAHTKDNMEAVYAAAKGCPHIIQAVNPPKVSRTKYSVRLYPVGTSLPATFPASEQELRAAARCILLALQALHSANWGHGDVRWQNVVQEAGEHFRLIDLECALPLGQPPPYAAHYCPGAWGPGQEALDDGVFTGASDLYMVGAMLREKAGACGLDSPIHSLSQQLLAKSMPLEAAMAHKWLSQ